MQREEPVTLWEGRRAQRGEEEKLRGREAKAPQSGGGGEGAKEKKPEEGEAKGEKPEPSGLPRSPGYIGGEERKGRGGAREEKEGARGARGEREEESHGRALLVSVRDEERARGGRRRGKETRANGLTVTLLKGEALKARAKDRGEERLGLARGESGD